MKTKNWKDLAEELKELIGETTKPAEVLIMVEEDGIVIVPKNNDTIHRTEDIVVFCACKKLSNYVTWNTFKERLEWVIF